MSNGNGTDTNDLSPGGTRPLIASQLPKQVMGNLLWKYAQDLPSELKNIVMAPGQVYSGELQPSMTPGPNQLSVPEYALGLAGTGLGVGGAGAVAGAELTPEGAITHFPAWHGTRTTEPFSQFSNEAIGTGEGSAAYGTGHYLAGKQEVAKTYMGPDGSLIRANIVPNEKDLLDWDLPWNNQDFDVKSKLINAGLDPRTLDLHAYGSWADPERYEEGEEENPDYWHVPDHYNVTGAEIYNHIGNNIADASELLNQAGVPGHKYEDAGSRGQMYTPGLLHTDDFMTAPNPDIARLHLSDMPTMTNNVDSEVDMAKRNIDTYAKSPHPAAYGTPEQLSDLSKWIDQEHKAGNFSVGDLRTHNYVIYDPKNIEVKTWNGLPVEPMEEGFNPFGEQTGSE